MVKVRVYVLQPKLSDEEIAKREGTFFEKRGMRIIDHDADVYVEDETAKGGKRLLAKFRKGVFPIAMTELAWDAFHKTAASSRNRGAAAGPLDLSGNYWKKRNVNVINPWSANYEVNGKMSRMRVNNPVFSSVLGYFEQTPFVGLPCRMTAYTQAYFKYYKQGLLFIQAIDKQFRRLVPSRYKPQHERAAAKPEYQIQNTAFSSVTINRNFRTGLHKDAGDFKGGFGNLSVVERGKYHGGETLFPQYGVGFDIRTGDFLAMDVHEWHCNTALYETASDKAYNKKLEDVYTNDIETGIQGSHFKFTRLSFVCYLREKLIDCDVKETKKLYKRIGFDPENGWLKKQ
jgi:hypothetical protein